MEKNTPNYNTKHSRITDFHNFDAETEKEELKKLKRSALKNPDDAYNLATNPILKFNNVTKKMDTMSKASIEDSIEAIEEFEKTEEAKIIRFGKFDEGRTAFGDVSIEGFTIKFNRYINDLKEDIKVLINKRIPKTVPGYNKLDEIKQILDDLVIKMTMNIKSNKRDFLREDFGHTALNSGNINSPFSKNYGEHFPIEDVPVDTEVIYKGAQYYVVENTGVAIKLSTEIKGIPMPDGINQIVFDQYCCIGNE